MCLPTKLQQNIIASPRDGDTIAIFLVSTMRGETQGVKVNHRLEAAKHLIRYGFTDDAQHQNQRPERAKVENTKVTPSPSGRRLG